MAAPVVARAASRTPAPGRLLLVGVFLGLLLGSLACASVLAAGHAHGGLAPGLDAAAPSAPGLHALHPAPTSDARPDHTNHERHERSGDASMASHPGMSCVVSVDLQVPEPLVVAVSERCHGPSAATSTEWSGDIDPPVPRLS